MSWSISSRNLLDYQCETIRTLRELLVRGFLCIRPNTLEQIVCNETISSRTFLPIYLFARATDIGLLLDLSLFFIVQFWFISGMTHCTSKCIRVPAFSSCFPVLAPRRALGPAAWHLASFPGSICITARSSSTFSKQCLADLYKM